MMLVWLGEPRWNDKSAALPLSYRGLAFRGKYVAYEFWGPLHCVRVQEGEVKAKGVVVRSVRGSRGDGPL